MVAPVAKNVPLNHSFKRFVQKRDSSSNGTSAVFISESLNHSNKRFFQKH